MEGRKAQPCLNEGLYSLHGGVGPDPTNKCITAATFMSDYLRVALSGLLAFKRHLHLPPDRPLEVGVSGSYEMGNERRWATYSGDSALPNEDADGHS